MFTQSLKLTDSKIGLPGGPIAGIVDIVICFNTSKSMESYLEQSIEAINIIAKRIEENG